MNLRLSRPLRLALFLAALLASGVARAQDLEAPAELDLEERPYWDYEDEEARFDWVSFQVEALPPQALSPPLGEELFLFPPDVTDDDEDPEGEEVPALAVSADIIEQPVVVKRWEGSFELGFNGSVGNTDTQDLRIGMRSKRKGRGSTLTMDLDFRKASRDQVDTVHRAFFDWRNEWYTEMSPWTYYLHGTSEFDQFRAFDVRVSKDGGIGYQIMKTNQVTWTTRAGAGASREFGGPRDVVIPEGVAGMNFERTLTKRQKFKSAAEFFFDWTDFSQYRINTRAHWEVLLDHEARLSLKLGVIDRYDSTPHGKKANDLDYNAVLLWSF